MVVLRLAPDVVAVDLLSWRKLAVKVLELGGGAKEN